MYRKQVRRRRTVLVAMIVISLILISSTFSESDSGPLHSLQQAVATILSPLEEVTDRALKPARDLVNWFDETFDARGENNELKSQVAVLQQEKLDLMGAAEDAGYLKELEKLMETDSLAGYEPVDTDVIVRNFSVWYSTVRIGAGSSDGVARNDAVVTSQGLIGRVSDVTGGTAIVNLITKGGSAVTARVAGKGPEGSVVPIIGSPGELDFTLIQGDKEIEDGDELVTAGFTAEGGLDSLFPGDIPIGRVSEAIPAEQQQRQQVTIEAFADISDLDEVTVLTGGERS